MTTPSGVHAVTRSSGGQRADDQRVVADGREVLRDAGEQRARRGGWGSGARASTSGACSIVPPYVGEGLVPEADAEHRHLERAQHLERDAGVARMLGPSGPGRDHDVVRMQRREVVPRQLVVAHDDRLSPLTSPRRWKRLNVFES